MKKTTLIAALTFLLAACGSSKIEEIAKQYNDLERKKVGASVSENSRLTREQMKLVSPLSSEDAKEVGKLIDTALVSSNIKSLTK